jgi:phage-related minor tail protein
MASEIDDLATGLDPLQLALSDLEGLADGFGRAMTTAFKRAVVDGKRLEDVLGSLALSLSGKALNAALAPIAHGISGLLGNLFGGVGSLGFAKGGVIGPGVTPFAAGGVVAAPSFFPMRGGLGLVGEAGPEAILPLARGVDGRLGVRAGGGRGGTSVTFNVTTRDAESFRRAEAELTAMLARAVARGQRGL